MVSGELIKVLRREFRLDWRGIHGAPHWGRAHQYGLKLAGMNGAKREVVELFAFLHDSKRINDGVDPYHGQRAAEFARSLRGTIITLSDEDFDLLAYACMHHSSGRVEAELTVQTCWDADRLDLGRVGIRPSADRLCTEVAKELSRGDVTTVLSAQEEIFDALLQS